MKKDLQEILSMSPAYIKFNDGLEECSDGKMNIGIKLNELSNLCYNQESFDAEYMELKQTAPDFITALKFFSAELDCPPGTEPIQFDEIGFRYALMGKNPYLYELNDYFANRFGKECYRDGNAFKALARGYIMGVNNNRLVQELKEIELDVQEIGEETIKGFNLSKLQLIGWLHELGVLDLIINKTCDNQNEKNIYKAAKVLASFVDCKPNTIKKILDAIYKPDKSNKKNHPFTNEANKSKINFLKNKLKIKNEEMEKK